MLRDFTDKELRMKYALVKRNGKRYVKVSEQTYSSFDIAAFVFAHRIVESAGYLTIRRIS
jgi:hypothetical protein